jgi:Zn-dependent alcohol dehydrogenase
MNFWIDKEVWKDEVQSDKRVIRLYRCKCSICEKCWYIPETNSCIYGGPYSGYIEVEKELDNDRELDKNIRRDYNGH